jgi:predicted small secreted protein
MSTTRNFIAAVLLGVMFIATVCNTVKGVGEDVESGGEAIQGAAEDAAN